MSDLTFSDTEQRIEGFQSRLRADYAAKIQEVVKLTDVVAKLQTQLLDVEYENNVLRQQFIKVKNENTELKKEAATASKKERSPSLELIDTPKRPPKKAKGKERADSKYQPVTSEPPSLPKQPAVVAKVKASAKPTPISEADTSSDSDCSAWPSIPAPKPLTQVWKEELKDAAALTLPKSITDKYLQAVGQLFIHPPALNLKVPRVFLRMNYGGHKAHFLVLSERNNPSGSHPRQMVFAPSALNPSMPTRPGDPGLFVFGRLHQTSLESPLSLFCSQEPKGNSKWRYLGEYKGSYVGGMSATCFRMQSPDAKQKWAHLVLTKHRINFYRVVRARIALRLASMIPEDDKKKEEKIIQTEAKKIKEGQGRPISEDDIIAAYSDGEEEVDIFRVHCVAYDHVFARDIQERFNSYEEANREMDGDGEEENEDNNGDEDGDKDEDQDKDQDEDEDEDEDSDDEESDRSAPIPMPKPTARVSKAQNNSNVRSLVNSLQATKPKQKSPVESSSSDSDSD